MGTDPDATADAGGSGPNPDPSADPASDLGALRIAREEARATLDAQLSTLDDVDEKAVSVFRLDVAVAGVLLSALSVAGSSGVATVDDLLNPATGASVALFVLSAAAAGLTYTAAGQVVGAGPSELRAATERDEREYLVRVVESYAAWIQANQRTNVRKALLVTLALLGTVAGAVALGVGVFAAVTGSLALPAAAGVVLLAALAYVADLHGQVSRLRSGSDDRSGTFATEDLDAAMSGQRTFKGTDRWE